MEAKNAFRSDERDLLRMFIRDIKRWPVLSREEEAAVAQRARAGDQAATDLLIESNLRFVVSVVFKYLHQGLPVMDLISDACLSMMNATKTFDPNMGVRFITYAFPLIKFRVWRSIQYYYRHKHDSLDAPIYDDSETTFKDLLTSHDPGADEMVFSGQIRKMLSDLDERERRMLILRFWGDLTLEEAGARIGVSKDRARQIENRSLRKLRWTRRVDLGEDHGESVHINVPEEFIVEGKA